MIRRLALLALGLSPLVLAAAHAADMASPCAVKCQRRPADSATESTAIAPNLETGGAYDDFRVTIDGATPTGTWTVDGDTQRATDLALAGVKIDVQVTTLHGVPVLSVVPQVPVTAPGETVTFYTLANYASLIARAELRVFPANVSTEATPLVTVPITIGTPALWRPALEPQALRVVLRVYDAAGRYDETAPQDFAIVAAPSADHGDHGDHRDGPLFDNQRVKSNIAVQGAEVTVSGTLATPETHVATFGMATPVDQGGHFVVQQIVPQRLGR